MLSRGPLSSRGRKVARWVILGGEKNAAPRVLARHTTEEALSTEVLT